MARIGLGPSGPPAPDPRAEDWWQSVYPTLRSAWDWTRGNPLDAASMSMVPGVSDVADVAIAGRDIGRFAHQPSRETALDALLSSAGAALPVLGAATVKRAGTVASKLGTRAAIEGPIPISAASFAKEPVKQEIERRVSTMEAPFDISDLGRSSGPQAELPRYDPRAGKGRGFPARVQRLMGNKAVYDQMKGFVERGLDMSGREWYDTRPLKEAFIEHWGPEDGPGMFTRYMDYVAASSPRSDVASNIRNASYYYSRDVQGNPLTDAEEKLPYPYGHLAQGLHKQNAVRVGDPNQVSFDPRNNPKPLSFSANLQGNHLPATIDAHAIKLPAMLARDPEFLIRNIREEAFDPVTGKNKIDPATGKKVYINRSPYKEFKAGTLSMDDAVKDPTLWEGQPNENEYLAMEQYYKRIAEELGITPAQAQAAAWVGGGHLTGLESAAEPFMATVNKRLQRTAAVHELPVEETTRRFVKGELPLLSAAPVGIGLGLGARTLSQLGADEEPY
jgi:hypothetical protein